MGVPGLLGLAHQILAAGMPDWCKGRAPTLEQAQAEAEQAFIRIRDGMSQAE
jgi:hypothetical protein